MGERVQVKIYGQTYNLSGDKSREEIEKEVGNLIAQGGKSGYILGSDCSIHNELPEERIRWVVEAARKI